MKIIHCADLHLNSVMKTNFNEETAMIRRTEILNTFKEMINYASENGVNAIIIAGDLFDTKSPSIIVVNTVVRAIYNHPELDFYYLKGNHDTNDFIKEFGNIPDNLKIFDKSWISYEAEENSGVVITGIESLEAHDIYDNLIIDNEKINIVVLHGQVSEYETGNKDEIVLSKLRNRGIDYLALGHIHSYKKERLDGRGIYCYPGCLEGRGFDECGEHGFVEIEINELSGSILTRFVPFACRNLYEVNIDATGCNSTEEIGEIMKNVLYDYDERHLIKVVIKGEVDVNVEINTDLLLKQFEDRFYFVKIYDETKAMKDYKEYENDKSLKGEFIRIVNSREDLSVEKKERLIKMGLMALQGEDI